MPASPHIGLPFLEAGQAQKHVTYNEALCILDALVQLSVVAVSASPPDVPEEGERHIVAEGAGGAFASQDGKLAVYEDGAWRFLTPRAGWRAWNEDAEALLVWTGTEWAALQAGGGGGFDPENVDHLFLNEAAPEGGDVKFAMRGETALLHAIPAAESGSGDVRLQISKEGASDTASVFFSTNFSGRAEFGLAGSDNFKLKVSADGTSWTEALDIDRSTGRVRLPAALALTDPDQAVAKRHIREVLTANRTYYVRTDGSDGNSGLANTSGGAFLTLQRAIDAVAALDLSIFDVTIQVADGTYTSEAVVNGAWVGSGTVTLLGNISNPENVVINPTSPASLGAITVRSGGRLTVSGLELRTTASGACLNAETSGFIVVGPAMRFGACAGVHMRAIQYGSIYGSSSYSIVGGAQRHFSASPAGYINLLNCTVTLSGTPAFSSAFAFADRLGFITHTNVIYSGSATGARYAVNSNAVINTNGAGANLFPGNSAGSAASGGLYL